MTDTNEASPHVQDVLATVWENLLALVRPYLPLAAVPEVYGQLLDCSLLTVTLDADPSRVTFTASYTAADDTTHVWAVARGRDVPGQLVEAAGTLATWATDNRPGELPEGLARAMHDVGQDQGAGCVVLVATPADGALRLKLVRRADPAGPGEHLARLVPGTRAPITEAVMDAMVEDLEAVASSTH